MEVEIEELRQVVQTLNAEGRARAVRGGFELTDATVAELEATASENEQVELQALADWELTVRSHQPEMTDDEFKLLREDLRAWLGQVIARHGVESALILYPENPRAQRLFEAIESLGLSFLPQRSGRVGEVRDWALQVFVRQPSPAQRSYLAGLLNTSFYMTVLTLDADASRLVQQQVAGHRVYLDTNFIYALLGLGVPASETLSATRLLELTKSFGYQLAVTQWTVDELRTSLRAAEQRLHQVPLPRQDLAHLMTLKKDENAVTRAYWMRYRDTGIRPKDFFEYYAHVETLLDQHGVTLVTEGCVAVDQNRAAIDDQLVLLDRYISRDVGDVVMEHDVKHRLLVERLRGAGHIAFSNARFWFLTRDTKLPRYAMATVDGSRVDLPFCVATSAWLQVIRAFTPRTEDFDQSLVDMLATPYLRYRGGPAVSPQVVDAVIGRISAYEGATPKLAAEVLADTALVDDIAAARSQAEETQKVEHAFIVKSEELRDRAEASERREAEHRASREKAERAADLARTETERERRERLALTVQMEQERKEHKDQRDGVAADAAAAREEADKLKASADALQQQAEDERAGRRKAERRAELSIAGALAIVAAVLAVGGIVLDKSAVAICVLFSVAALLTCGTVRFGLGRERGGAVLQFVFGFAGIVALIVAVVLAAKA
jgi:hypothetical protein